MQYYCIHHNLAYDRKDYINTYIKPCLPNIHWIESYLPDCTEVKQHHRVLSEHASNREFLRDPELSCFMKHREAISYAAKHNDYSMIFEDDIQAPDFDLSIHVSIFIDLMSQHNTDILFIGSFDNYDLEPKTPYIFCSHFTKSRCAHAYIVSQATANKLTAYLQNIRAPIDWQLNYAIEDLTLRSCWSYPHIYQRTEKQEIKSLLR